MGVPPLEACEAASTICCLCRGWCVDGEVGEEALHGDADLFVVSVDRCPGGGLAAEARAADAGEDRCDDVVSEGDDPGDGASGVGGTW